MLIASLPFLITYFYLSLQETSIIAMLMAVYIVPMVSAHSTLVMYPAAILVVSVYGVVFHLMEWMPSSNGETDEPISSVAHNTTDSTTSNSR